MERELATQEFEIILDKIARLDEKAKEARRKRDREYLMVLAVPFAFIIASCLFLNGHFAKQDRINQETLSVQEAKL